jgi:hypothetical protein
MTEKYMKVQRIEHGTVIDHIFPGKAFDVLSVLGLSSDRSMSILINSHSRKGGKKDILKIEGVELSGEEANRVALVSPRATINIIVGGEVVKKFNAEAAFSPVRIQIAYRTRTSPSYRNSSSVMTTATDTFALIVRGTLSTWQNGSVPDLENHLTHSFASHGQRDLSRRYPGAIGSG